MEINSHRDGLYFNTTSFADTSITFSAKVFFEKTDDPEWRYRSTGFEALDVRPKVEDLAEYGAEQATASDLKLVIDPSNITFAPQTNVREATEESERRR